MKIGLFHTTIRGDEKLLIEAAQKQAVDIEIIDVRKQILNPEIFKPTFNVALNRCVSLVKGTQAMNFFEQIGIPVVNNSNVARICENKFTTSLVLKKAGLPTPKFAVAFSENEVKKVVKEIGDYPVVIKPVSGSWGRLLAKVNDDNSLEAVLEHKDVLGGPLHKVFYIQEYIKKPERDIRVTVVGNNVVCAIYREAEHWITNTARAAEATKCEVDEKLKKISLAAAQAVGGGVLGVDVFETSTGYTVNEVNHTTEFKNVQRVTKVDVAEEIIKYCLQATKNNE